MREVTCVRMVESASVEPCRRTSARISKTEKVAPRPLSKSRAALRICSRAPSTILSSVSFQAPVVAGHEVPLRELELARLEQLKAELAADRVRWRIVNAREGVHEAVLVVALGELDRLRGRRPRDAAPLEIRHDHPTDLVDLLVAPLLRPEADRADASATRHVDNLEHTIAAREAIVADLALAQFVRA